MRPQENMRIGVKPRLRDDYRAMGYSRRNRVRHRSHHRRPLRCPDRARLRPRPHRQRARTDLLAAGDRWPASSTIARAEACREARPPRCWDHDIPTCSPTRSHGAHLDKACAAGDHDFGIDRPPVIERLEDAEPSTCHTRFASSPKAQAGHDKNKVTGKTGLRATAADLLARFHQPAGRDLPGRVCGQHHRHRRRRAGLGVSEIVPLRAITATAAAVNKGRLARPPDTRRPAVRRQKAGDVALRAWRRAVSWRPHRYPLRREQV